mgnify:CR=1 FL=1
MGWTKQQQQAIDTSDTNIIVSAGAGSGKTAVLTARVLRLLQSGIHINELLILTFTKAAAGEMKERILKTIKKNPDLKEEQLLIDQAYITTFDSFALAVLKKYHYLLNLKKDISISEQSIISLKKKEILEEIFLEFYEKQPADFCALINDFCTKDDEAIKQSILKIADIINALPNKDEYLKNYSSNYQTQEFIDQILSDYEKSLKKIILNIKYLKEELYFLVDNNYQEKCEEVLKKIENFSSLEELERTCSNIKLPALKKGSAQEIKEAKDNLKKEIDNLKDTVLTFKSAENITYDLKESYKYQNIIITITQDFLNRLNTYKRTYDIYDFTDVALLAIKILKENEFARLELKESFKEIMIDEYQDTNDIQETFISLISSNNVYMVGDIKQSIYRFRNANPYIFKNKYDNYTKGQNGLKIDLVQNFRSRKEVLDNINSLFNLIMDLDLGGADYTNSHQMVFGNTSYIEEGLTSYDYNFKILEYDPKDSKYSKEEIEIFTIGLDIKKKIADKFQVFDKDKKILKDITYNDFVILMDRTTDFDLYKKIFEYLGIPLSVYKDEKLTDSTDLYILKSMITFLVKIYLQEYDLEFKYAFVSLARSYLFNLDDEKIFTIITQNQIFDTPIYKLGQKLADLVPSSSINELLKQIILETNWYEKLLTINNINLSLIRLSKLTDIAINLSTLGYNIITFKDYLTELLAKKEVMKFNPPLEDNNSVKIMTIHKSKGLEYPICYFSGLYKEFNISDLKEKIMYDKKYGLITPIFKEGMQETILKYLAKQNYLEEEISEKIRIFYVALTRAKEHMILLLPTTKKEYASYNGKVPLNVRINYKSIAHMLYSTKKNLKKYYEQIDLSKLSLTKDYLKPKENLDNLKLEKTSFLEVVELPKYDLDLTIKKQFSKTNNKLINKETYNNLQFGTKAHQILELLDFKNPNWSLIEDNFLKNKIKKFLEQPLLKNLNQANIYKEYEFIFEQDCVKYHGIIDLILEYPDYIDIIDYKLKEIQDENYIKQLTSYQNYIKKITNKPVYIYLYSLISENMERIES